MQRRAFIFTSRILNKSDILSWLVLKIPLRGDTKEQFFFQVKKGRSTDEMVFDPEKGRNFKTTGEQIDRNSFLLIVYLGGVIKKTKFHEEYRQIQKEQKLQS